MEPGNIIGTFTSKKGNTITFRYPKMEDLDEMTRYINELSKEDTYINFSGEVITKEQETEFLEDSFKQMELNNVVLILAFNDTHMIGISNVNRNIANRTRKQHIGLFGLSLESSYRGEGIGYALAKATIEEAIKTIKNLKIIELDVYGENTVARNVYKKLGFVEYGILPNGLLYRSNYIDDVKMYLEVR